MMDDVKITGKSVKEAKRLKVKVKVEMKVEVKVKVEDGVILKQRKQ